MNFQQKYIQILNIVHEEIGQVLEQMVEGIEVQEPLKSKLFDLLNAPAKHIRPLVSFLYLKASGGNIDQKQIQYQAAIELVHNASLIHDDVIDESNVRRNIPTLNNDFGNKLAVISGDYLLSVALNKVIKIAKIELLEMFSDTLAVMSEGEIKQHFNKYKIPSVEEYIKKSEQKTAKLFETAICGSLLIANNSSPRPLRGATHVDFSDDNSVISPRPLWERENLLNECNEFSKLGEGLNNQGYEFAKNFGIAFQIRDDLINCKTTNTDITDGVYNAPVIFSGSTHLTSDAIEKTQILLNNYVENAKNAISDLQESKYKSAIIELLELLRDE